MRSSKIISRRKTKKPKLLTLTRKMTLFLVMIQIDTYIQQFDYNNYIMDQQVAQKRYLSTGNKIVVNREFLGLGHTLESKKKERKLAEHDQKEMANKLMKLEQQQEKAIKDLQKKYEQLQNIYKIRLRKQSEQEHKQKLKQQKEQEIRLLKLQWRQQRQRNAAKKKQSYDNLFQNNRNSYLMGKSSKKYDQLYRQQSEKKMLQKNINKTIEVRQNKESGLHKIIQYKRSKNKESIDYYNSKLNEQEQKKNKNLEKIKNMNEKHKLKLQEYQKSMQSKSQIQNLIKQAHEINLVQLEKQMIANKPSIKSPQTERRRSSLSRNSTKSEIKNKRKSQQSFSNGSNVFLKENPQIPQSKPHKKTQFSPAVDIEDTIKAIQKIEFEQSTDTLSKVNQKKSEVIKSQIAEN